MRDEFTYENDEIGDEHAILDTLPAAVHSAAQSHDDGFVRICKTRAEESNATMD